jgi:probable F420-dependent oxidoreductase
VLAVAAGATQSIRLLSSILLAPFYHPTVLAKMTTSLDIASRGRLTLGVGVGGEFPVEFEAAGLNVRQRGRRTDECLEVMRRLWTEDHVSFQGKHFTLNDVSENPKPYQKPHPPVWVAGRRDAAMRRAALLGDGWLPYFYDPARYVDSIAKIHGFAAEAGRDLSTFQWGFFPYIAIYPTKEEAEIVCAESLGGNYLYGGDFLDVVRRYCITGTPQDCIERLAEYVDAGARHIVFSVACPVEDRARHVETIASEIIPKLRERFS